MCHREAVHMHVGSESGRVEIDVDGLGRARLCCHGGEAGGAVEVSALGDAAELWIKGADAGGAQAKRVCVHASPGRASIDIGEDGKRGVVLESREGVGDVVTLGGRQGGIKVVALKDGFVNLELASGKGALSFSSGELGTGVAATDTAGRPRVLLGVQPDGAVDERVLNEAGHEVK